MFDEPHRAKTTANKLTELRQRRRSVVTYAAEFRRIIMDAEFDNNAKVYWFRAGLSDAILDELVHKKAETDLDELIAQCVLIDNRLLEREVERKRRSFPRPPTSTFQAPANDPMVLDSANAAPKRGPISTMREKGVSKKTFASTVAERATERQIARASRETAKPVNKGVDGQTF
jgi:hypothetical protein